MLKSLARGAQVLKCFTPDAPSLPLSTIASELGIPKGSAFRLVSTLEQLGFLEQDPSSKRYRLGVKVLTLGQVYLAGLEYPDVALPHLEELALDTGESASMVILDGTEVVYIARASLRQIMRGNVSVGSRLPSYCTSTGKVLLAHLEPRDLDELLRDLVFEPFTHKTVSGPDELRASLPRIREEGYAVSDGELDIRLRSIAAPVRNMSGRVVGAVNVTAFASRVPEEELKEKLLPRLFETAQTISNVLGFRPGARAEGKRRGASAVGS